MAIDAPTSYGVMAVFFALTIISAILRFYTRIVLLRKFSLDDYVLLAGLILLIVYTAVYTRVIYHLFRAPFALLGFDGISNIYKYAFIMLPFYLVSSMLVKLSIALRLLKFTAEEPVLKWIVIFALTIYELDAIVMIVINFTQCLPPAFTWARPFKVAIGPNCAGQAALRNTGWVFSALTCFLDFTLAVVPWFIVRKLWRTHRRTRIMLSVLLGLGSIASLATIARMFYNYKFTTSPDPTNSGNFFLWTYLELTLAAIACSAATLKPLVTKALGIQSTTGVSAQRTGDTADSHDSVASTWSAYLRNFSPFRSMGRNGTSNATEKSSSSKKPDFSFSRIFVSSKPRVLRHPLSVNSLNTNRNTNRNMRSAVSRDTTQFTITDYDDSDSDDLGPAQVQSRMNRRSNFESLEAQIEYALDEESHK